MYLSQIMKKILQENFEKSTNKKEKENKIILNAK